MNTRSRHDLVWVLAATALSFALASQLQWQERLLSLTSRFEAWQLDELPLTLTVLSLGLAWYAWRRRQETAALLARNRELAQRLIQVQEGERLALARDLHDDLAQHCSALRVEAACLQRAGDPAQTSAAAQRMADLAEGLQLSVRGLLRRLRPAELDELGLVAALRALCAAWQQRSGVACELKLERTPPALGEAMDAAIYRVTQEALNNVLRHARASAVRIELSAVGTRLVLSVDDDGQGFLADGPRASQGLGLLGARERAAALGGQLSVSSLSGQGVRLRMSLPITTGTAS